MPNHVTNILTIHGPRVTEIYEALKGMPWKGEDENKVSIFDFEKIIPMPVELKIESNGLSYQAEELWRGGLEPKPEDDQWIHRYYQNLKKYGYTCWYGWSVANWGTKWNSYSQQRIDHKTIRFETAWSMPLPIYKALSRLYPEVKFEVRYADEDMGHNCGHLEFLGGEFVDMRPGHDFGTKAARVFARRIINRKPKG